MSRDTFNSSDAQKSEVHAVTGDAEGSPTSDGDQRSTIDMTHAGKAPEHPHRMPSPLTPGTHIVRDETSVGGPLVIETDDPDLSAANVPKDPFPTERTPEIDPPISKG